MEKKTRSLLEKILKKLPDSRILLALTSAIILAVILYVAILLLSSR